MDNKIENVAIVTLCGDYNIGNKLQNYALQQVLREFAQNVTTLTYYRNPPIGWKGKLVSWLGFPRYKARVINEKKIRYRRFKEFNNDYLNMEEPKHFSEFGNSINDRFDFFVSGSDQVWHNFSNTKEEIDFFMLSFAEKEKRVCYAPSFGFDTIPKQFENDYLRGLQGFRRLSCREINGCEIIKKCVQRNAELMPDPTMGLSAEQWIEFEKKPSYFCPEHYIFAYFLGKKGNELKNTLQGFSVDKGMPIIDVFDEDYLEYFSTRPDEFIYLVNRADYVYTNSYHCAVFSILFHKKFRLFKRTDKDGMGMGARFSTLLHEFGLVTDDTGMVNKYENVDIKLEYKRKLMRDYIKESFSI